MRECIALLRSPSVNSLGFESIVLYLEDFCRSYKEDILWPEESKCPYREECIIIFEGLIHSDEIKSKKEGGKMKKEKQSSAVIVAKLLTVRDVANTLKCKQSHVMKLIRSGRLPATKHGWVWAISSRDLEEFQTKEK